jgi:hypothetical protein
VAIATRPRQRFRKRIALPDARLDGAERLFGCSAISQ